MLIGYMVGFETEEGWKPMTFWERNGYWYASIDHTDLSQYANCGLTYTVFTSPVDMRVILDSAIKNNGVWKTPLLNVFLKYSQNPIIVEVDLEPINQANMSESRKKEYFYHKLSNTREAV